MPKTTKKRTRRKPDTTRTMSNKRNMMSSAACKSKAGTIASTGFGLTCRLYSGGTKRTGRRTEGTTKTGAGAKAITNRESK